MHTVGFRQGFEFLDFKLVIALKGMQNILVIGAGRSSHTLISYLLSTAAKEGWLITVADAQPELAEKKVAGHPNGLPVWLDVNKPNDRKDLIRRVNIVISLLPAHLHTPIAQDCLLLGKHLLTASYITPEIQALDALVREKQLIFLGEMGFDPGIDHMSAMEKINSIKARGGKLLALRSYAGGLVAPESNDNPWHYKFTWNPRNVVLAGRGTTQYLDGGTYKYVPYHQLFKRTKRVHIDGLGEFDMYPNRDSLTYRRHYGLEHIPNLVRGTLRYPGFCDAWSALIDLGLTDDAMPIEESSNMRYRDLIDAFTSGNGGSLMERVAQQLHLQIDDAVMQKLSWLDLFGNKKIKCEFCTPAKILESLLIEKWLMKPTDRDMVILQHEIDYSLNGRLMFWKSSLVQKGSNAEQTAMNKLVGLPLAIATKLIMKGKIHLGGVRIPVDDDIYEPVLAELKKEGVVFTETEREME